MLRLPGSACSSQRPRGGLSVFPNPLRYSLPSRRQSALPHTNQIVAGGFGGSSIAPMVTSRIDTSYGRVTQSFHFVDSKSAGAYTRRGQLSWLGEAFWVRLTRWKEKIKIGRRCFQFGGRAEKIGHGPATVIGCRWNARVVL